jgi:GNAT superfamily N-acetyltransferase
MRAVHDQVVRDALHVRPAGLDDRDQIWPLVRQFATSFEPERAAFDASYDALFARQDTLLAVAEVPTGVIAGYALTSSHLALFANGSVAWVEELMVAPDHRRSGVGAALMRGAEEWAREQGAAYVALATRRAADFYRALGYSESATYFRKLLD